MFFVENISQTIQTQSLIQPGDIIVVGVSGGADSLALLHVLHQLHQKLVFRLHVATLDHGLRGESSAADVRFVQQTCRKWDIPITSGQANWERYIKDSGKGIEEGLRAARYDFLARVAHEVGARKVAVAHNANDQAETILMHIVRGTGMRGLAGMLPQSPMPQHSDLNVIRPFLNVTRTQIEDYCHEHGLQPRHDATNHDIVYLRNRLRLETLPYLQQLNPQIIRTLNQLADITTVENDYLTQQLQQAIRDAGAEIIGKRVFLSRVGFARLHTALQRRLITWSAEQITTSHQQIGYFHILSALKIALEGDVGALALFPGGLHLRVDYKTLVIEHNEAEPLLDDLPLLLTREEVPVNIPGVTPLPESDWILYATTQPSVEDRMRLAIPPGSEVTLRVRCQGDRFSPLGMHEHTQKMNRWMINQKIPVCLRDHLPLFIIDNKIAAIMVGDQWPIAESFAVKSSSDEVIYFQCRKS